MATENPGIELVAQSEPFIILNQGSKNYRIDNNLKRITFLDNRFYFGQNGEPLPSVTTILDCYPKGPEFFEWLKRAGDQADDIRDEAGDSGSKVHALTEDFDRGKEVSLLNWNGEIGYPMHVWNMLEKYVQFRYLCHYLVPEEIETTFVSDTHGFGGTKDRVFVLPLTGKRILVDIKTSNNLHDHYWCQLAAYREARHTELLEADPSGKLLKEGFIDDVAILWLKAKTKTEKCEMTELTLGNCQGKGWQLITRGAALMTADWTIFQTVHRMWLIVNGEQKPRQTSYQLSHQFVPLPKQETVAVQAGQSGTSPSKQRAAK